MEQRVCSAAVFVAAGSPLEIRQFQLPGTIDPGAAVCRVVMSTICGSDLHTISGRRTEPAPLILGHEIIGEIFALGDGLKRDGFGAELHVGDRVSWSVMACCGRCFYCLKDLPQKCERLRKYGHSCCNDVPHLTGGYAEYICLFPGTAIFKVPAGVRDDIAAPANCALSTVINAAETIGLAGGQSVLIQGAGMLGLNLIALACEAGAARIIVTDVSGQRLALASEFGADLCINVKEVGDGEVISAIRKESDGRGVDVAFEVCGDSSAVPLAVEALRIGGRYLIAGLVTPDSGLGLSGNTVTRKCLTIKGIHNYRPDHLRRALEFLENCSGKYPYGQLVSKTFPLSEINEAVTVAGSGRHVRVGIR